MGTNQRKKRALIKQIIFLVVAAVTLAGLLKLYYIRAENAGKVGAYFYNQSLPAEYKNQFMLEMVSTTAERRKGLMFRKELPEDQGMLFIFPEMKEQVFHMKNTFISLDMIFIDDQFKVVGVLHSMPVNNTKKRTVGKPSKYVVELIAGAAKRFNIKKGTKVKFSSELPRAVN